jgi:hypothetical protein
MNTNQIITDIVIGGALGIIGQGIRVIVGVKKLKDVRAENRRNADNTAMLNAANTALNTANTAINAANAATGNTTNAAATNAAPLTPPVIPAGEYDSKRLGMSLFIGFVAGALGGLFAVDLNKDDVSKTVLATLISIGYAGVDFIEGMMTKLGTGKP